MTSAVHAPPTPRREGYDRTELPFVVRQSIVLGTVEAILVLVFSLATRVLEGPLEVLAQSLIVFLGLAIVTLLPGIWTRPRTIEGIAGAAGIGLGAAACFLVWDAIALRWIGTYTNRWEQIGGGSNWWYHPVWWMVGTFIPWMGAFAMANQTARRGGPAPAAVWLGGVVLALVLGVIAASIQFPGATIGLPTFAVAYLPALALMVLITGRGSRSPRY